jgi:4-hydroxybenzoate polyprenyltransferase
MTSDNWLGIFILALICVTAYGILTNKVTDEERDEMLNDEEMFP